MKSLKKSYSSLLLVVICIVFCISCKKDVVTNTPDLAILQQKDIEVRDGYLSFKNDSVFRKSAERILKSDQNELDQWEKNFIGFRSYRDVFNKAQDEFELINSSTEFEKFRLKFKSVVAINPDTSIAYKLGTPLLGAIINLNGEFQIGATKYCITEEGRLVSYPAKLKMDLKAVRDISASDSSKSINVINYAFRKNTKNPTVSNALWEPFNGVINQELRYSNGRDRRLYIEVWRECVPGSEDGHDPYYFNYYIKLLQESKKTFGGWGANKTDYTMTDAQFWYQYIPQYWGIPLSNNVETAPKVTYNTVLPEYHKNNFKGAVYIPLYSGTNWGSFIWINALIHSGGVPHYNVRYSYGNIYIN